MAETRDYQFTQWAAIADVTLANSVAETDLLTPSASEGTSILIANQLKVGSSFEVNIR